MNKITEVSMKNVVAVLIVILLLFGAGSYSASILKVESMPDVSFPVVVVLTTYPAPPKDVMEQVTKPIEKAVANMDGIKNLTSSSSDNISQVVIELTQGKKPEDVKRDVESLLTNVKLPQSAERPRVLTQGFSSTPIYYLSLYSDELNRAELDKVLKETIVPGFNTIRGLDHIDVVGDQEATIDIKLNGDAMNSYGLSPSQVAGAVKSALMSVPAGSVDFDGSNQMARVRGNFDTVYALERLSLTTPSGTSLLLSQISTIESINRGKFITRFDGKPAIAVHLFKTKSANVVEFSEAADVLIEDWKRTLPQVKFEIVLNGATEIKNSINGMMMEGLTGMVLASLMIFLFLRNIKMTLIVIVSLPISILLTMIAMAYLKISLNIMTLGSIVIAIGRIVDDSIVVIENIYSKLQKAQQRGDSVILEAVSQVSLGLWGTTITSCAVFFPLGMVSGVVGEVFRPFAITTCVALLASTLVAVTVIPMMAKLLVMRDTKLASTGSTQDGKVYVRYRRMLLWSLNNPVKTLTSSAMILIVSIVLIVPVLPVAFMPESDADKSLNFEVLLPREMSLEKTDAKLKELEALMVSMKEPGGAPTFDFIESMVGYAWSADQFPYRANIIARAAEKTNPQKAIKRTTELFEFHLPKGSSVFGQVLSITPADSSSGFTYTLKGEDPNALKQGAILVKEKLKQFPELSNIKDSLDDSKTELDIAVDHEKARTHGLQVAQVYDTVKSWLDKESLGEIRLDNILYKANIEVGSVHINSLEKVGSIPLRTQTGQTVQLHEIAHVKQVNSPIRISRDMQEQNVTVTAAINSADKGGVSAKVAASLKELELPSGVKRQVKGAADEIQKSFEEMFMAITASIFIVYLILVITFGNASAPFAILFSLPLAVIGGLLGLLIANETLSVTSLIGFLMLVGIVVANAIVLIERVQQLREEGVSVRESLLEAGVSRLRPIAMTTVTTLITLVPLTLGLSQGGFMSKGLAVVVIGGLTTSTLLTLVVVPTVYELNERIKNRMSRRFSRSEPAAPTIQS